MLFAGDFEEVGRPWRTTALDHLQATPCEANLVRLFKSELYVGYGGGKQEHEVWTRGTHTVKSGFEYRTIQSDFQFLGSTEITYNSINDFIDNRPNAVAVTLDSPLFRPEQFYAIGFAQDSWRATDRLTLELGLRYDYYSVVQEAEGRARPFFVEENAFGTDADDF